MGRSTCGGAPANGDARVWRTARADMPRGTGMWPGARHRPLAHSARGAPLQTGGPFASSVCMRVRTAAKADAARRGAMSRTCAFWLPSNSKCHCLTDIT
jgi:hypothetical protein